MRALAGLLLRDARGTVAAVMALSTIPAITLVGAAVDYSSAAVIHAQLQADTDAAVLIACKSTLSAPSDLKALAQATLTGYMPRYAVAIDAFASASNPRSVSLTSRVQYPTKFMKIANIITMPISASSTCAAGENVYEIALVLDTTGSMNNSAGSTSKIEAMKSAAGNFVTTMFGTFDAAHIRMSLVPFAASVKVDPATYAPNNVPAVGATWLDQTGASATHWQNVLSPGASGFTTRFDIFRKLKAANSGWGWAGCLEALPYPYNTQDATPSGATPNTRYVPLFAPDEVGTETMLLGIVDLGHDTSSPNTDNSYLDDGTATTGPCDNDAASRSTRMGQACKYAQPTRPRTGEYGPNWGCTSRALTRLTNVQSTLTAEIGQLAAAGNTNIAEGLHWGWRTVSATGVFGDAAAYGTANTTKVIVLMTDGVNTWNPSGAYVTRSEYSAYGFFANADGSNAALRLPSGYANPSSATDARNALDQLTRETCANAKARNVVIFAVAFSTPGEAIDAGGQQLLRDCASGADKFMLATDAAGLNTAFLQIARGIGALRITR